MANADIFSCGAVEHPHRFYRFIIIVKRLTHAHIDDVVYLAACLFDLYHLIDDLGRRQIAGKVKPRSCAELTVHSASDLCRNAQRAPAVVEQLDSFYPGTVAKFKKIFFGAVRVGKNFDRM